MHSNGFCLGLSVIFFVDKWKPGLQSFIISENSLKKQFIPQLEMNWHSEQIETTPQLAPSKLPYTIVPYLSQFSDKRESSLL